MYLHCSISVYFVEQYALLISYGALLYGHLTRLARSSFAHSSFYLYQRDRKSKIAVNITFLFKRTKLKVRVMVAELRRIKQIVQIRSVRLGVC